MIESTATGMYKSFAACTMNMATRVWFITIQVHIVLLTAVSALSLSLSLSLRFARPVW